MTDLLYCKAGETPGYQNVYVYLNGVEIAGVSEASAEHGWIIHLDWRPGCTANRSANNAGVTRVIEWISRGHVEIRPKKTTAEIIWEMRDAAI